jgi:LCP family protein required for cell wall assembly
MPSHRRVVPSIRHGKLKKRPHPIKTIFKTLGIAVAVVAVSAGSVGAIEVYNLQHELKQNAVTLDSKPTTPPKPTASAVPTQKTPQLGTIEGGANILLVGSDSGDGNAAYGTRGENLNDVTILIHINADHEGMSVISFPRDTFVNIPQCTNEKTGAVVPAASNVKINTALSRGGVNCVAKTVENLTGASIPYAALIQFDGVIAMSNAVGGVPVCVNADINDSYTGLHLTAGEHTLQGADALAFLRTRHGVGDGSDLGRISNQQVFLSSLIRVIKSNDTITSPSKLYSIATVAAKNVVLSTSLTDITTMMEMALTVKAIPLSGTTFIQYPTALTSVGTLSGVAPIKSAGDALMSAVLADKPLALTGGTAPGQYGSIVKGSVPDATPTPSPSATGTPTSGATTNSPTPTPTATKTPEPTVSLPAQVTGQKATEVTCSNANHY